MHGWRSVRWRSRAWLRGCGAPTTDRSRAQARRLRWVKSGTTHAVRRSSTPSLLWRPPSPNRLCGGWSANSTPMAKRGSRCTGTTVKPRRFAPSSPKPSWTFGWLAFGVHGFSSTLRSICSPTPISRPRATLRRSYEPCPRSTTAKTRISYNHDPSSPPIRHEHERRRLSPIASPHFQSRWKRGATLMPCRPHKPWSLKSTPGVPPTARRARRRKGTPAVSRG